MNKNELLIELEKSLAPLSLLPSDQRRLLKAAILKNITDVVNKNDLYKFDKFTDRLFKADCHEVKIIEDFNIKILKIIFL